ncbi:MAG: diguanylate cyclase [Lysobacter sp.]|nr:MAG: diguanylate cyclase [Lysobacter sp.]
MPSFRTLLSASLGLGLALVVAPALAGRTEDFDALFRQIDDEHITQATPEESKSDLARLHALIPRGDVRRELLYRSLACFEPPDDARASLAYAQQGLADARQLGDAELEARFLYCRGAFEEMVGNSRDVIPLYTQAIALSRKAENRALIADGLVARGSVHSFLGEHAAALADFMSAQRIYETARLQDRIDTNLQNIGVAYRRMGEFGKAHEYLVQSRRTALREQDWFSVLAAWLQLGFLHEDKQQADAALEAYGQALEVARQHLGAGDAGSAYLGIASARVMRGEYPAALRALALARADFASVGDTSNEGMLAMLEGQARAGLGEAAAARALFNRAESHFAAERNERYLAMLYPERARLLESAGDTRAALHDFKRYVQLRERLHDATSEQRSLMLQQQFDASQREFENRRLRSEKTLRDQQVQALLRARRWQWGALALGAALILVLGTLVARQLVRTRRLRVLASTDELTGIANRRRIELIGEDAIAQAIADGRSLSVVTFDIDLFKRINDTHGHLAGDQVIIRVADACRGVLRQFDEIGRTGGEEFLVILPDSARDAAEQVAERLRSAVEALRWEDIAPGVRVTISLGITSLSPGDARLRDLLSRADTALYAAKAGGRNRLQTA